MTGKFVIATNSTVPSLVKNSITIYLQSTGWQIWHWFEDLWLVAGVPDNFTAKDLAAALEVRSLAATGSFLVLQIEGESLYYGRAVKEAWQWMYDNW